jgi:cytoskeleton protein RodZ
MLEAIDAHEETFAAFDGTSVEIPQNLLPGTALRHAREAMGASIRDVSRHTRIPERHLEAIERADYRVFRARLYAVGFSRSYARYVGLAEAWIAEAVHAQYQILRVPTLEEAPNAEVLSRRRFVPTLVLALVTVGAGLLVMAWVMRIRG